jgi:NitT/TauT family transport system substrate-binding protein
MKVSDYKNLVSTGIIAGTKLIKKNPAEVTAFITATMRGEKYTLQHRDAAFKMALKRMPEIVSPKAVATQRLILDARMKYQTPVAGHAVGWSNPAAWPTTLSFMQSIGAIPRTGAPKVGNVFTNRFTDAANVRM